MCEALGLNPSIKKKKKTSNIRGEVTGLSYVPLGITLNVKSALEKGL
jgi:hypothetical protein